ncbi:MAG: acetoin utilization protein AcuC [Desulfobacteraceae bacterium]|nr:MAG: acetoin utilization protein AcuC [Desulfobacteraceae bacterium]
MNQNHSQNFNSIFIYSDEMGHFSFGPQHPFKPERVLKTYDLCLRYGLFGYPWMTVSAPEPLDPALLTLFHEPEYIRMLKQADQGKVELAMLAHGLGTPDTPILKGIYNWSLRAAGGTHFCLQRILAGGARTAFNPLGGFHHAMPGHAEGFCYLNDGVLAIKATQIKNPDLKIAYIDLDAHHGNGVQHAFYQDPQVLYISLHETGRTLYPWSGAETEIGEQAGRGFNVNVPLEPDTDDEIYNFVFNAVVPPLVGSFAPQVILAELGADTLISDPLTHLKLTNNTYQHSLKKLLELCPSVLALGGGGYDLYRTARCWTLAWAILNNLEPQDEYAGSVGGMMFGPENEVGSLFDHPYHSTGEPKAKAWTEARRIVAFIQKEVFPVHGL